MSWKIKDEWIDGAECKHVVIFENSDTKATHQLIHHFMVPACPTCGACGVVKDGFLQRLDFDKHKAEMLATLNAHHRMVSAYMEANKFVRRGTGPR